MLVTVAIPPTFKLVVILALPPTYALPPTPTPPVICKAPEFVDVELVVFVINIL